jgi:hypothetical protein
MLARSLSIPSFRGSISYNFSGSNNNIRLFLIAIDGFAAAFQQSPSNLAVAAEATL